jgi:hypothetical protein
MMEIEEIKKEALLVTPTNANNIWQNQGAVWQNA